MWGIGAARELEVRCDMSREVMEVSNSMELGKFKWDDLTVLELSTGHLLFW